MIKEFDIYEAPIGHAYEKDGEKYLIVIVPKGSETIKQYTLIEED